MNSEEITMKRERWEQIKKILEDTLEGDLSERQALLEKACAGDDVLRQEVEAYLKAHDSEDDFLNMCAMEFLAEGRWIPNPLDDEEFAPGEFVDGRYLIVRGLGKGGFSKVFLTEDQKLHGKEVAIKILLPDLAASEHGEWLDKHVGKEAKSLAILNHPGIVPIFDIGVLPDGRSYLVMAYVPGPSLRSAMKSGPMPLARAGKLIEQIALALTAAHEQGIIHRDVKPENIMLQTTDEVEQAKLIDFGIAEVKDKLEQSGRQDTKAVGTLAYMAPEQARSHASAASDIFSLGVIAYELVTGQRPFDGKDPFTLEAQKLVGVKIKPRDLRPNLPLKAQQLILRALAYEPADRFAKASDFGMAFSQALGSRPPNEETPLPDSETAHVLFGDLVGSYKLSFDDQTRAFEKLQSSISATQSFKQSQEKCRLLRFQSGNSFALAFFGDPVAPVKCALEIGKSLHSDRKMKLRMGIHTGPVQRSADITKNLNLPDGGINLAKQVMESGKSGQIMISETIADAVRPLKELDVSLKDKGLRGLKPSGQVHIFSLYTKDGIGKPTSLTPPRILITLAALAIVLICVYPAWQHYQYIKDSELFEKEGLSFSKLASRFDRARQVAKGLSSDNGPLKIDDLLIGVTIWKLTPASEDTGQTRIFLLEDNIQYLPDRTPLDSLKEGDKARMAIELPRNNKSYVYVVDREVYADGTTGAPYLIFPGPTTSPGGNVTTAGKLLYIPAVDDPIKSFTLQRSRENQVSERLTIIVSPKEIPFKVFLEKVSANTKMYRLDPVALAQQEKRWHVPFDEYKDRANTSLPWTREEQLSGEGKALLVSGALLPQTIYRAKPNPGEPLLITVSLPVKP